jgi:hypothetical protein
VNPAWLAANADRERTVGVLRAGFTEGRLGQDELGDRIARAYAARTYSDLWALTADLPQGPLPYPGGLPAVPYQPGNLAVAADAEPATNWHSAAALVITALVIFTLAALVTAIATAHAQAPLPFQQGSYQPAQLEPIRQAQLAPFITNAGGQAPRHAHAPVRP